MGAISAIVHRTNWQYCLRTTTRHPSHTLKLLIYNIVKNRNSSLKNRFANISDGSIVGIRAPYLRVGGNKQFQMMEHQFFVYDASITASLGRVPIWPYTLFFRMPHKCNGNAQNCPSRSHPVWEMVMNELDRRDDPTFDESLPGLWLDSSEKYLYFNPYTYSVNRLSHGRFLFKHPNRRTVRTLTQAQLQSAFLYQPCPVGITLPRFVAQEQTRI